MSLEILTPSSRAEWLAARTQSLGASEVAALFGVHPFTSIYELHHVKAGTVQIESAETAPLRRGRHLEQVAVNFLAEERPAWTVTANPMPGGRFYRDLGAGLSCTPDAFIADPEREGGGIAQIKSVEPSVFRAKWRTEDGLIEPPLYVAIQAIQEAALTGASWAVVCPLVVGFGLEMPILEVPLHLGLIDQIRARAADFWQRVAEGRAPDPDYAKDGALLAQLHADDDGSEVDLTGDNRIVELLDLREGLKEREQDGAAAEKERKILDAEILSKLQNAARGRLADGRSIEAKTIRRAAYQAKASSYRSIKIKGAA